MSSHETKSVIRVEDLHKRYPRVEGEVHVLKGINLDIMQGETLAVVGVSGAGKSTLLHMFGALDRPTSGKVMLDGMDLNSLDSNTLANVRNKYIGFVFQFHHLLPEFNVIDNTIMPARIARQPVDQAREKAEGLLGELGLSHRLTHLTGELSGGEQQRVAVARAMIMDPRIILADEPTGNLDAKTGSAVEDTLIHLNQSRGVTIVIVTHNEALANRMQKRIRLYDGQIVDSD